MLVAWKIVLFTCTRHTVAATMITFVAVQGGIDVVAEASCEYCIARTCYGSDNPLENPRQDHCSRIQQVTEYAATVH